MQPPEDADLKRTIDAMAPFVARNGAAFEAIAVRQNARDNRFSFLKGGPGAEYYRWRVQASLEMRQKMLYYHIYKMPIHLRYHL